MTTAPSPNSLLSDKPSTKKDPTLRFSDRVADYIKYRPSYPPSILMELQCSAIITSTTRIADIGSGTGKFTELLLTLKNPIYAVEPNDEMREAASKLFSRFSNFTSIAGSAEATTLTAHSIHLITVAQALHWFRPTETLLEFHRILSPKGHLAVIWNERSKTSTPFLQRYEQLLRNHCPEYRESPHLEMDEQMLFTYIDESQSHQYMVQNFQEFDYNSLEGRLRSSSYVPLPQEPGFSPLIEALHQIFDQYQQDGKITFEYITQLYYGPLNRLSTL